MYGEGDGQGRVGYCARANEVVYGNGVGWARWKDPIPRYHVSRDAMQCNVRLYLIIHIFEKTYKQIYPC